MLLRLTLLGLALPCVYFGGGGLAFFYRQRAANAAHDHAPLPPAPAPTQATRLIVFAPHCDDETLGCAGLMQQTLAAGGQVQSVILTNGDGFRTAVERQSRTLRVGPKDYIQFAALRQDESVQALGNLGITRNNVLFLGYPDRGLMALWNANWMPDHPYISSFTSCDRSPYANTYDANARYCGKDVIADIRATLRAFRPTLITVTHPSDDHPDHAAAAAFVTRALQEAQADPRDASWARRTQIKYYLIHRGDWPQPQGTHPGEGLFPPSEMIYTDTHWMTLPLKPQQTAQKLKSIEFYPSQTALMRRFLVSFARRTELYGDVSPSHLLTVPENTITIDASARDWEKLPPALLDPVRDNVLRDLQGGGDIRALYACRDSQWLYLRLDTRQPVNRRFVYTVRLRAFRDSGATDPTVTTIPLRVPGAIKGQQEDVRLAARGRLLEAAIPWKTLTKGHDREPIRTLGISVETTLAGVEVDKTGIRFLNL